MTPEQREYFEENYIKMTRGEFLKSFNEKFGTLRGRDWLRNRANEFNIDPVPPDYYSISELASICGMKNNSIVDLCRFGKLKSERFGRRFGVHRKDAQWLIDKYVNHPTYPVVTSNEASAMLGYNLRSITARWRHGSLPGYIKSNKLHVRLGYVMAAKEQMQITGHTRAQWRKITDEEAAKFERLAA